MTTDVFSLIKEIAIIVLLVSATTLCTIMAVAIAKLSPIAVRSAKNLEKVTSDAAEAGPVILEILSNSNTTTANLAKASGDVAKATTPLGLLASVRNLADLGQGATRLWEIIRPLIRR